MAVGSWYLLEWHMVYGASAATTTMQAKVDGTLVAWNNGSTTVACEHDEYPYVEEFKTVAIDVYQEAGATGQVYFDDFKITDGVSPDNNWIGGTDETPATHSMPNVPIHKPATGFLSTRKYHPKY